MDVGTSLNPAIDIGQVCLFVCLFFIGDQIVTKTTSDIVFYYIDTSEEIDDVTSSFHTVVCTKILLSIQ